MRNVHMRRGDSSPLTVHLEHRTGIWLDLGDLILRIEREDGGSARIYNDSGEPFTIKPDARYPSIVTLGE